MHIGGRFDFKHFRGHIAPIEPYDINGLCATHKIRIAEFGQRDRLGNFAEFLGAKGMVLILRWHVGFIIPRVADFKQQALIVRVVAFSDVDRHFSFLGQAVVIFVLYCLFLQAIQSGLDNVNVVGSIPHDAAYRCLRGFGLPACRVSARIEEMAIQLRQRSDAAELLKGGYNLHPLCSSRHSVSTTLETLPDCIRT